MARVIKNIMFVLLIVLLVGAILCTVGMKLLGYQFRAVLTGSMEPDLPVGSMLVVKSVKLEDIKLGDDITFVRDKKLTVVTHRVVAVDVGNQLITTRGIANNTDDAPVYYENVIGTVRGHVPYLGYAVYWVTTTQGRVITITAIVALVLIWLILGIIIGVKKKPQHAKKGSVHIKTQTKKESASSALLGSWLDADDFTATASKDVESPSDIEYPTDFTISAGVEISPKAPESEAPNKITWFKQYNEEPKEVSATEEEQAKVKPLYVQVEPAQSDLDDFEEAEKKVSSPSLGSWL